MIAIEVVNHNGVLIGRRVGDRHNLAMLGIRYGLKHDRNSSALKAVRRRFAMWARRDGTEVQFSIRLVRDLPIVLHPTLTELSVMGLAALDMAHGSHPALPFDRKMVA